jgi:hypothetical protein
MRTSSFFRCYASGWLLLCLLCSELLHAQSAQFGNYVPPSQTRPRPPRPPNYPQEPASFAVSWPYNGAVFQRRNDNKGKLVIQGSMNSYYLNQYAIFLGLTPLNVSDGQADNSKQPIDAGLAVVNGRNFQFNVDNLDAGWYEATVAAFPLAQGLPRYQRKIKVGIGEVFIIAGQSNAQGIASSTDELNITSPLPTYDAVRVQTNNVNPNTFMNFVNGNAINAVAAQYHKPTSSVAEVANDPNRLLGIAPSGNSLWYWASLGEKIASQYKIPVAFYNAAWGGTHLKAWWLSKDGTTAPPAKPINPVDGENNYPPGAPYRLLRASLNLFGSIYGVRAVLWLQGETDVEALKNKVLRADNLYPWGSRAVDNADDYKNKLREIITQSRNDFSLQLAWMVGENATTSDTEKPGENGSEYSNIVKAGQIAAVNAGGQIFSGPDLDASVTVRRTNDYIHFGAPGGLDQAATAWYNKLNPLLSDNTITPVTSSGLGTLPQLLSISQDGTTAIAPAGYSVRWVQDVNGSFDAGNPVSTAGSYSGTGTFRAILLNGNGNRIVTQAVQLPFRVVDDLPEEGTTICLEGEVNGGGQSDPNASGGQFVGFGNAAEGRDYTINVSTAGNYTLKLTYASPEGPTVGIRINGGAVQAVGLSPTSTWSSYTTREVAISLPAGNSTLRVQGGGSGSIRFDKFCYGSGTPPPVGCDFTPSVSASPTSPGCGASVQLTAGCSGADCNNLSYAWSNSGGSNATASYTLPNQNGTHTYTVSMSRSGCTAKEANKSFTLSGCGTTDPTNCIEAEASTTSMDVQNSGQASGGQFVGNFGETSAFANFAVNVASGGDKTITLTYAAAGGSKQVRVQVNDGAEQTLTLASTGGWESFATQTISVNLPTGSSTLKFKGVADNYWRLDKICLPGTPPPVGNCYEGESLGGGQNDPNASGGQFIGFGNQFEGRDYPVNATGTLHITYASGDGPTIGVKIGSGSVQAVTLGATPGWSSYQTYNTNISVSGATTVRIQGGSGYVRLDRFCISSGARQAAVEPGIAETDELNLRIAPNPSNGRFVARFRTVASQAATLTLTDEAGRAVRAVQTIVGTGAEHAETIQLPAQVRGVLLLQVVTGGQRSIRKVLIE